MLLVSTESQFIQIGGEPTCAVLVSRSDHERTIELLKCGEIRNLSCRVESSQVCNFACSNIATYIANGSTDAVFRV